jgi:two-component system cell cycle response regulator
MRADFRVGRQPGGCALETPEVKVLVIEDHKPFRDILVKVLGLSQYRVIPVELGAAGLEAAQTENPDIVLLDLMMPGLDGYETCRRLRAMPNMAHTPIVVLTALAGEEVENKVREAGADVCLTKPCSIVELERVIKEQLQRRRDAG